MSLAFLVTLAALSALAAATALWPLLRRAPAGAEVGGDDAMAAERATLLAALRENERDREAGRIGTDEAEAARAEIGRRLLAADRLARDRPGGVRRGATVPIATALAVPLLAIAFYAATGSPGAPDRPLGARIAEARGPAIDRAEAEELVRRAEARLAENPEETAGWLALAPAYRALGRDEDAANALRRALPGTEGIARARALVDLTDIEASRLGRIDEAGAERLREALRIDPASGRAGFLLALYVEQTRSPEDAASAWRALIARHEKTGSAWLDAARTRLARLEGGSAPVPPEVREMVEGLDARLREAPDDPEGWLRLVQSRSVLNERDAALDALARGRAALAGNRDALAALDALAAQLGLATGPSDASTPPDVSG